MYTDTSSTTSYDSGDSMESKYTVADILSSMANGEPPLPVNYSGASSHPVTGVTAAVTSPLLTPTTLANLEQSFIELTSATRPYLHSNQQQQLQPPPAHVNRESGFVPPVVNVPSNPVVKQECGDYYSQEDLSDTEWSPPGAKRMRMTVAAPVSGQPLIKPVYTMPMTSMGEDGTVRRSTRRINDAELPTEEREKRQVRRERNKQAAAKCRQRRLDLTNTLINETEGLEDEQSSLENEIQNLQQQKEQLEFLLQAHQPVCAARKDGMKVPLAIKKEQSPVPVSSSMAGPSAGRPTSLSIPSSAHHKVMVTSSAQLATGLPMSTPSSGSFILGLDSMMDGHTGLTPITGAPSCSSQVQRSSSDSSPGEGLNSPTRLLAL